MPRKKQTKKTARKTSAKRKTAKRATAKTTAKPIAKRGRKKIEPLQLVKGVKDILPGDMLIWKRINNIAEEAVRPYGFKKIDIPIIESTDLFIKTTGEETDIVQKEMFSFTTKGGEKVTLRPEGTPGATRAYIEHGMHTLAQPVKLYYTGPMFRYERPQAGRYRQFHQFGMEVFGNQHPVLDAEIIHIAMNIIDRIGIKDAEVQVNSGGCSECRDEYRDVLVDYLTPKKRQLCEDCKRRLKNNPYRILDCKKDKCKQIASGAPPIVDYLCEECDKDFKRVLEFLDEAEIPYALNTTLMRGLDYYTKTIFEIWTSESDKSPAGVLGGGGRYDELIKSMGGKETPALGMAFGIERIVEKIKQDEIKIKEEKGPDVLLVQLGDLAKKKSLRLFDFLIESGINVREAFHKDSIKAQLRLADKMGVKLALILGQKEAQEEMILVRNMKDGVQEMIKLSKVVDEIKRRLKEL